MTMTGLRGIPGAPNLVFNLVFPHVQNLRYWHVIVGSFLGQAVQNYCFVSAGQILASMTSVRDALTFETTCKIGLISVVLLMPTLYNCCKGPKRGDTDKKVQ